MYNIEDIKEIIFYNFYLDSLDYSFTFKFVDLLIVIVDIYYIDRINVPVITNVL